MINRVFRPNISKSARLIFKLRLKMMVVTNKKIISKSRYLSGLQCSKLLWNKTHAKDQLPPVDPETQAIFDQGHVVTGWAQKYFPGGIEVVGDPQDYESLFKQTELNLKEGKPLFEAAFTYKNSFARPDALVPNKDGSWDLFEVKSSTELKDVNLHDVAFQTYCYEGAGLKIRKAILVLISNEYVRKGEIDVSELFRFKDLTAQIRPMVLKVESNIESMLQTLDLKGDPQVRIARYCLDPYECVLKEKCWSFLPADNVLTLNRIRKEKAFKWIYEGIQKITDIPAEEEITDKHTIQRECARTGRPHQDKIAVRDFLGTIKFPVYLVDFETCTSAVPLYDGMRPYQQIPFQFSLLTWEKWEEKPSHTSFLWTEKTDPRAEFMKALTAQLGDKGSILAYNLKFERGCIEAMAKYLPQYEKWWAVTKDRMLDLLTPFEKFYYYHPKQKGSASIKAVYPAMVGGSYEGLAIADGSAASREYTRFVNGGMSDEESKALFEALEIYCSLDTQAMYDLMKALDSVSN